MSPPNAARDGRCGRLLLVTAVCSVNYTGNYVIFLKLREGETKFILDFLYFSLFFHDNCRINCVSTCLVCNIYDFLFRIPFPLVEGRSVIDADWFFSVSVCFFVVFNILYLTIIYNIYHSLVFVCVCTNNSQKNLIQGTFCILNKYAANVFIF